LTKKQLRNDFRNAVFERDGYCCAMCGRNDCKLDAHHVQNRKEIVNGGYVKENGITLCDVPQGCHWKAEQYHATGTAHPGYSPEDLFAKIGSSIELAVSESEKLK
jgi:hypothetical protein